MKQHQTMFFLTPKKPTQPPKPQQKQLGAISYTHKINARSRSYKLKVDPKGNIIVVTPPRFNQQQLESFILTNKSWIEMQSQKWANKKSQVETDTHILVLGKLYEKKILVNAEQPSSISVGDAILTIYVPENSPKKIESTIQRFLQQTAEHYITTRVDQLAKKMSTSFNRLKYGEHKTQWGSCHRNGTLTFNWRLIHAPRKVIDYVIVHELAHRTHHDHSHRFWELVEQYDPEFKTHKKWLAQYGVSAG